MTYYPNIKEMTNQELLDELRNEIKSYHWGEVDELEAEMLIRMQTVHATNSRTVDTTGIKNLSPLHYGDTRAY